MFHSKVTPCDKTFFSGDVFLINE